ncbi:hypothetical protein SDC9_169727 [bioreactor metagenome]|uniref:Uncharacterized protein n=1 Tax=bioreactor metagenome TaxID=1076179 RepID=A0A645GEB5_9ZZZZ
MSSINSSVKAIATIEPVVILPEIISPAVEQPNTGILGNSAFIVAFSSAGEYLEDAKKVIALISISLNFSFISFIASLDVSAKL